MTADLALQLSYDGIGLLVRRPEGWVLAGSVDLNDPDLGGALARLRDKAVSAGGGGPVRTRLVIPNDQIRYLAIDTTQTTDDHILAVLDGATPYGLDELGWDVSRGGGRTYVAAVARTTLAEAEAFAREHDFGPLCFVAVPEPFSFMGEVFFGPTELAKAEGWTAERAASPLVVVGTLADDDATVTPDDAPATEAAGPLPTPEPASEADAPADLPEAVAADAAPEPGSEQDPVPAPSFQSVRQEPPETAIIEAPETEALAELDTDADAGEETGETPALPVFRPRREHEVSRPAIQTEAEPDGTAATATGEDLPRFASVRTAPPLVAERATGAARPRPEEKPPAGGFRSRRGKRRIEPTLRAPAPGPAETPEASPPAPAEDAAAEAAPAVLAPAPEPLPKPAVPPEPAIADDAPADPSPQKGARQMPAPRKKRAAPAIPPPPPDLAPRDEPVLAAPPADRRFDPPEDERERLTIFGARGRDAEPTRRGRSGLAIGLTILLLAALLAVGLLAGGDGRLSDLFGRGTVETATPDPTEPDVTDQGSPALESTLVASETATATAPSAGIQPTGLAGTEAPAGPEAAAPDSAPTPATLSAPAADAPLNASATDPGPGPGPADPSDTVAAVADAVAAALPLGSPPPGRVLSPAEAERIYAATGVWQRAPRLPFLPRIENAEDVYVTTLDQPIGATDAVALPPDRALRTDASFVPPASPPPPGARFPLDERGFVAASPDGTLTPEGHLVFAGSPPVAPPPRPTGLAAEATPDTDEADAGEAAAEPDQPAAPALRPRARPEGLTEAAERSDLGGLTRSELAAFRPRPRPEGLAPPPAPAEPDTSAEDAAQAALAASIDATVSEVEAARAAIAAASPQAVATSVRPDARPRNMDRIVERARSVAAAQPAPAPAAAPQVAARPSGAVPGGVAAAATDENVLNLREISLIGLYGADNDRRALVRLSNGRYVRVSVGDRLDGGRVTAIGENALSYTKRGRTITLTMPRG